MTPGHVAMQLLGAIAVGAAVVAAAAARAEADPGLRAELGLLARRSVFFGHQSVGGNVVDALAALVSREDAALKVLPAQRATEVAGGTLAHGLVPENGAPMRKLESFEAAFTGGGAGPDLALVKFCYVDFHAGTDPKALFEAYRATLARLRASHPETTFVHVTAPLTTVDGTVKALAKRLLGREGQEAQNARREAYNALVRAAYQGREPLFDLARVESTRPDGGEERVAWKGQGVPVLVGAYTDDGGHLNAEGARRAARELVRVLAAAPVAQGAAQASGRP